MQLNKRQPVILDQEGIILTNSQIIKEKEILNSKLLEERRPLFEKMLEERCHKDNEVFNNLGYNDRAGMIVYQVGMSVYGIRVTHEGLSPVRVGIIQ